MIEYKKWDSEILGYPVGEVDPFEEFQSIDLYKYNYVTARVPAGNIALIRTLEACGFRVCSTLLTFKRRVVQSFPSPDITMRLATKKDIESLIKIGEESFYLDRYHTDPYLTWEEADKIYASWITNEVTGKHGDAVFVAVISGDIVGFTCCRIHDNIGIIDLTAVAMRAFMKYKCKFLAVHLLRQAASFLQSRHVEYIITATQSTNRASIASLLLDSYDIDSSFIILSWKKRV